MKYIKEVGRMVKQQGKSRERERERERLTPASAFRTVRTIGRAALLVLATTLILTGCPDATGNGNNNGNSDNNGNGDNTSGTPSDATAVQNAQQNATTDSTITLIWGSPTDTTGYEGVTISAEPNDGNLSSAQQLDTSEHTFVVTGLTTDTPYSFTIRTRYSAGGKENDTVVDAHINNNPIDRDGDRLIDINTIEQLNNIRHTLDGRGYRDGAGADLMQCGAQSDTDCTGYELMRSLDFADATSYASGTIDATLRPNNSDPDAATNSGWDPIGSEATGNRFNSRFEGNGYTISNLYGRLSSSGELGFFGFIDSDSVIRSVGVATVRLYGSDGIDNIGALVGDNRGTIIASYATGTVNGGAGADNIGALVGITSSSTIIASYANGIVNGGADVDNIGALVGLSSTSSIMASYASGSANGDANDDRVGGLVGGAVSYRVTASYATATADGGAGDDDVGSVVGVASLNLLTAVYGFGTTRNKKTVGLDNSDPRPAGVALVGSGIAGASMLTLDSAGEQWNQVVITDSIFTTITTMDAWDFGDNTQAPALRYADYDGPNSNTYGCGDGSNATIVIPSVVATPTGPMTITYGVTLLPEQAR